MHKIVEQIKKELKQVESTGLNAGNLDTVGKMIDIMKDIKEIGEMEGEGMRDYEYRGDYNAGRGGYNEGGYNVRGGGYNTGRGGHNEGGYGEGGYGRQDYTRGGNYGRGGNFINMDPRMWDRLERIMDGADMYSYGRDRYRGGDSEERMDDGLEKMMYAVCMFIESTMDFAETPQEKEIIRKHIHKLKSI
jgi:hypothetical protein